MFLLIVGYLFFRKFAILSLNNLLAQIYKRVAPIVKEKIDNIEPMYVPKTRPANIAGIEANPNKNTHNIDDIK